MILIVGYVAIPGKGKTLASVFEAVMLLIKNWSRGNTDYKIFTNISLDLPEPYNQAVVKITSMEQIKNEMRNGVFIFDEMWKWADARLPTTKINRFWSSWSIITRKKWLDLLYTEQYEKLIDVRIRAITKYVVRPYQYSVDHHKTSQNPSGRVIYYYTVIPYYRDFESEECIFKHRIINSVWFSRYDTYEEPAELEGGSYMDEAREQLPFVLEDSDYRFFEKKGEQIGHIKDSRKISKQTATAIWQMMNKSASGSNKIVSKKKIKFRS